MSSPSDPHAAAPVLRFGAAPEERRGVVILLHGRGATAESILELARLIDVSTCTFLAPQAASVGYGPAWYPHSFLAPLAANEPWLASALKKVEEVVTEVVGEGLGHDRIVVAGFSQGACLASEFVARNARRWGGLVALSGGLIGSGERNGVDPPADKLFEYDGDLVGTRAFLGCSDIDPHIPVERVHETARVLAELGTDVDERVYPGMGHTVNDDELEAFQALVGQVCA